MMELDRQIESKEINRNSVTRKERISHRPHYKPETSLDTRNKIANRNKGIPNDINGWFDEK